MSEYSQGMFTLNQYDTLVRKVYRDDRGYSGEIECPFVPKATYFSYNKKYVFRGFHGQPGQLKMVTVLFGSIFDYVLDPVTGEVERNLLLSIHGKSLVITDNLLHGFYSLEDSLVFYQLSEPQNKETEYGFRHSVTTLPDHVIFSERDINLPIWKKQS